MAGGGKEKISRSLSGSRIAAAICIGVLLGCVFAFLFPHGLFSSTPPTQSRRLSKSTLQVEKLQLTERGKGHDEEQFVATSKPRKAGPFGTVQGLRTNPAVLPDESVNPRLAKILVDVAVRKELIVALDNSNVKAMLQVCITSIKKAEKFTKRRDRESPNEKVLYFEDSGNIRLITLQVCTKFLATAKKDVKLSFRLGNLAGMKPFSFVLQSFPILSPLLNIASKGHLPHLDALPSNDEEEMEIILSNPAERANPRHHEEGILE